VFCPIRIRHRLEEKPIDSVGPALAPCRERKSLSSYAAWRERQPYIEKVQMLTYLTASGELRGIKLALFFSGA